MIAGGPGCRTVGFRALRRIRNLAENATPHPGLPSENVIFIIQEDSRTFNTQRRETGLLARADDPPDLNELWDHRVGKTQF